MEVDRVCPQCHRIIPGDDVSCPYCREVRRPSRLQPDALLLLTIPALVVLFVITGFAAKFYHAKEKTLAEEWSARGEADLKAGRSAGAIEDLRTSLVYSRENPQYRFLLAQALIKAQQVDEAKAYLTNLWEQQPGSGKINLELARLAAGAKNISEAMRYYHDAIYGVWEQDPLQHRIQARLELCRFLLANNEKASTQSELMALAAVLPPDSDLHGTVANLFLDLRNYPRALEEYQLALRLNRNQEECLGGAAESAFQMGDYHSAERYYEQLQRVNPHYDDSRRRLDTLRLFFSLNPYERRLNTEERNRRMIMAFDHVLEGLRTCASSQGITLNIKQTTTDLQQANAAAVKAQKKMSEKQLNRHPELFQTTWSLITQMERAVSRHCSPLPIDKAVGLIDRQQGGGTPQ